jgi:hypothetical protein
MPRRATAEHDYMRSHCTIRFSVCVGVLISARWNEPLLPDCITRHSNTSCTSSRFYNVTMQRMRMTTHLNLLITTVIAPPHKNDLPTLFPNSTGQFWVTTASCQHRAIQLFSAVDPIGSLSDDTTAPNSQLSQSNSQYLPPLRPVFIQSFAHSVECRSASLLPARLALQTAVCTADPPALICQVPTS